MNYHEPSKKMQQNYQALLLKTAELMCPRLASRFTRKGELQKLEKNLNLLLQSGDGLPVVGNGATTGAGSDCYPHTIVEVADDFSFIVTQSDNATPTKKHEYYGNQSYTYSPQPDAVKQIWTLRKNGRYVADGAGMKSYNSIGIRGRHYYQDPSF